MECFIARQPIFDKQTSVYAYELLYRSSTDNFFDGSNEDEASLKVIVDSYLFPGSNNITEGKPAFINFTRSTLLKDCAFLLPRESTVIELLETVRPEPAVLEACRRAKDAGYRIALDDFDNHVDNEALIDIADIIKVDFLATTEQEQQELAQRFKVRGISLVAEKVETWEVVQRAAEMGYTYFQGYFFGQPLILTGRDIPANKLHYLNLLREMQRPELQFAEIEELIRQDLSLSYKLLRYLNSAAFGFRREIGSVRQAVAQLGEQGMRKWVTLIALVQISDGCSTELVNRALIRAGMCESIAISMGLRRRAEDLYLLGIFSCLDAILGRSLSEVLDELPVSSDIRAALLGNEGGLSEIFKCTMAYENGNWEKAFECASKLSVEEAELPEIYRSAVMQAGELFRMAA
jgi:c-di-GMP-related signal transduction protein